MNSKIVLRSAVIALLIIAALAFWGSSSADVNWDVAKSKTATQLDSEKNTTVTLSLPSAEYEKKANVDVVLVMDKSAYSDIKNIEAAADQALDFFASSDTNVKFGVVVYDGWGHDAYSLANKGMDDVTGLVEVTDSSKDEIKNAISFKIGSSKWSIGGSNSEQPVRLANRMLAADTETPDSNKFLILLSDMETYVYEGNITMDGETYGPAPISRNAGNGNYYKDHMSTLDSNDTGYQTWDELFAAKDTVQSSSSYETGRYFRYGAGSGSPWKNYWSTVYQGTNAPPNAQDLTAEQYDQYFNGEWAPVYEDRETHYSANDVSLLKTYDALKTGADRGYNISIFSTSDDNWNKILKGKPLGFMKQCQEDFGAKIYGNTAQDSSIVNSGQTITEGLEDLVTSIEYLISSGTLTDVIGEEFDLVMPSGDASPFTLSVGGTEISSVKTGTNEWSYGEKDADSGKYPYVIRYDSDSESFSVEINVPVRNAKRLKISYDLTLTTDEEGTYPTNKEAYLDYTNSTGDQSGRTYFEVPYVTYSVPDPSPVTTDNLTIRKEITGDTPAVSSEFTFRLTAQPALSTLPSGMLTTEMPMPDSGSGTEAAYTITGAGTTEISGLTFAEPGTYVYNVTEDDAGITGYTSDDSIYQIRFVVTKSGGTLNVTRTILKNGEETDASELVFTNTYEEQSVHTDTDDPSTDGGTDKTSDNTGGSNSSSSSGGSKHASSGSGTTPKTGDTAEASYLLALAGAGAALFLIRRRMKIRER
ncbi:MAG: Spy0128 family protein [Anaerovoracaceae bacterium]|jgi:pilin isopeptide linkage protein